MSKYSVQQKQSGVLGITCRDSFVADSRPNNSPKSGGGCSKPKGTGISQVGWNSGGPFMSQPEWNANCPGSGGGYPGPCGAGPFQPGWSSAGRDMLQPGWTMGGTTAQGPGGWGPCNCDESDTESSSSSSSSSSDSSSTATKSSKGKKKEDVVNPMISRWYNFEFCTCETQLPEAYIPKPKPKKKPPVAGPQAGIWCGSPCCAVAEHFPPKGKRIARNPLQLKLKEPSSAVPPGTCCFRNDQLIFQVPNKGNKGDSEVLPFYKVGQDEQPLGVKMMRPEDNPEMDPNNNTYILKITKTDAKGKPAKMQLALKIPRPPDASVPENETSAQYSPEDYAVPKRSLSIGRKSKGRRKSNKSGSKNTTKTASTKRTSRKTTRTSKTTKTSKSSKVKFRGLKKLVKEIKKKAK